MKIFLFIAILFVAPACKKNNAENSSLIGKWKLTEYLADPGNGSGTWQPADPLHPEYLEFKKDGILIFSANNIYNPDHYQITSDSTMIFIRSVENFPIRYHLYGNQLSLYPPCIEACGERYISVH